MTTWSCPAAPVVDGAYEMSPVVPLAHWVFSSTGLQGARLWLVECALAAVAPAPDTAVVADNTFWIAALTGGTAVVASWVTSRGNTRAARIQADAATVSQRMQRLYEARRAAYLDFIQQGQRMAELYWKVSKSTASATLRAGWRRSRIFRDRIRDTYGDLRWAVRVIELEGPDEAAAAAYAVKQATTDPYQALNSVIAGDAGAGARFDACYSPYWAALSRFVDAAKSALHDT